MVSSIGWTFLVLAVISFFMIIWPIGLSFAVLGAFLIWIQLRGIRASVDTTAKWIDIRGSQTDIKEVENMTFKEVRKRQTVNSRASSTVVHTSFFHAYLHLPSGSILISSNKDKERDLPTLRKIAAELQIELVELA